MVKLYSVKSVSRRKKTFLKAYVSEEILNWHCLSLNTDVWILFYWLSRLRQANHRQMIQSSALRLRLWLCHFKISSDTQAFSLCQKEIIGILFLGLLICLNLPIVKEKERWRHQGRQNERRLLRQRRPPQRLNTTASRRVRRNRGLHHRLRHSWLLRLQRKIIVKLRSMFQRK